MTAQAQTVAMADVDRFVLPAGEPRIASYLHERLLAPHNLRERLRRAAHLSVPAVGLPKPSWSLRLGPAGEPEEIPANGHRPALEMIAAALAAGLLRGTPLADQPLRWLLVEDYAGNGRERLVLFLFIPGEAGPAAVLKLRRTDAGGEPLQREAEALRFLAERLPADLAATVPGLLAYQAGPGIEALAMTPLPGVSAYVEMQGLLAPGRAVGRHLAAAAAWLARFQQATRVPGRTFDAGRAVEQVAGLEMLRDALAGCRLPLVAAHGDFWARNLLVGSDDCATVADWEGFAAESSPLEDLFCFPLTYGLEYPWVRWRRLPPLEAFRLTFLADNRVSREVARYLARTAAAAGIDAARLRSLFHLYLLTRPGTRLPWLDFHRLLARAGRSVFSG